MIDLHNFNLFLQASTSRDGVKATRTFLWGLSESSVAALKVAGSARTDFIHHKKV